MTGSSSISSKEVAAESKKKLNNLEDKIETLQNTEIKTINILGQKYVDLKDLSIYNNIDKENKYLTTEFRLNSIPIYLNTNTNYVDCNLEFDALSYNSGESDEAEIYDTNNKQPDYEGKVNLYLNLFNLTDGDLTTELFLDYHIKGMYKENNKKYYMQYNKTNIKQSIRVLKTSYMTFSYEININKTTNNDTYGTDDIIKDIEKNFYFIFVGTLEKNSILKQ